MGRPPRKQAGQAEVHLVRDILPACRRPATAVYRSRLSRGHLGGASVVRHRLRLQPAPLVHWVGQLAEAVGQLAPGDKQFESLDDPGAATVRLGQRRDLQRVVENKRGLHQRLLH